MGVSDSDRRVPAALVQESQASYCLRKGTPLASRVAQVLRGSQAPRRAVCGTRGSLRTMHGGGSAPSCCAFTHTLPWAPAHHRPPLGAPSLSTSSPGHLIFLFPQPLAQGSGQCVLRKICQRSEDTCPPTCGKEAGVCPAQQPRCEAVSSVRPCCETIQSVVPWGRGGWRLQTEEEAGLP